MPALLAGGTRPVYAGLRCNLAALFQPRSGGATTTTTTTAVPRVMARNLALRPPSSSAGATTVPPQPHNMGNTPGAAVGMSRANGGCRGSGLPTPVYRIRLSAYNVAARVRCSYYASGGEGGSRNGDGSRDSRSSRHHNLGGRDHCGVPATANGDSFVAAKTPSTRGGGGSGSGSGGECGGGRKSSSAVKRATRYSRLVEAARDAGHGVETFDPILAPSGLHGMAETQMRAAVASGSLQGLAGEGKRISVRSTHRVTHFGHTENAEMLDTLAAQGLKPPCLERRDEAQRLLADLRVGLRAIMRRRMAADRTSTGSTAAEALGRELISMQGVQRPLNAAAECTEAAVQAYNDAVLRDQLTFGAVPVHQVAPFCLESELADARALVAAEDGRT